MSDEQKPQDDQQPEPTGQPEPTVADASLWQIAQAIADSRDFPDCRTPAKALVRILAGKEMGVGPIASVTGIRIQAGRVSMDAGLMAGVIERSGTHEFRIAEHSDKACALHFFRGGQMVGPSVFEWADAEKAGLHKKDTWKQYPRNLLFARALSNGARWYCSGLFGRPVYTHEELGIPVDAEGNAIQATNGDDEAGGGDNGLCTREQRVRILALAQQLGQKPADLIADLGVKILDELAAYEAGKLIKKMEKQLAKQQGTAAPIESQPASQQPTGQVTTQPELTPAQQMLKEAIDDAQHPITPEQRQRIIELAEAIAGDEAPDLVRSALAKRNCSKLAQLNKVDAGALIASMEAMLAEPPFDAGGNSTTQPNDRPSLIK